ncbi:MAG: TIGR03905 family TSCPD domain-containing protein [Eubacterium sp.]|nr:TIGR03905 family TSCPD domain-containing protein [Eubacterium sp.]
MKHVTFKPQGVCSVQIDFDIDDEKKLHNVAYVGGCNGNLKAIGKLVEGKEAEEIAEILKGNTCGFRKTSCADQLSLAISGALAEV